jgi:hypothetical protein
MSTVDPLPKFLPSLKVRVDVEEFHMATRTAQLGEVCRKPAVSVPKQYQV